MISMIGYKAFAVSRRGASHKRKGTECQDYSLARESNEYVLMTVCDGHGGDDYFRSARGSEFAAKAFDECVCSIFCNPDMKKALCDLSDSADENALYEMIHHLVKNVIYAWRVKIKQDVGDVGNPNFSDDEMVRVSDASKEKYRSGKRIYRAYGTTFIGACMTEKMCFGFHVGDGDLFGRNSKGEFRRMVADDPKCVGNFSTSLCGEDAYLDSRVFFCLKSADDFPVALFATSDGVIESYASESSYLNLLEQVFQESSSADPDAFESEIGDVLDELSDIGSCDDMSLAGIVAADAVRSESDSGVNCDDANSGKDNIGHVENDSAACSEQNGQSEHAAQADCGLTDNIGCSCNGLDKQNDDKSNSHGISNSLQTASKAGSDDSETIDSADAD